MLPLRFTPCGLMWYLAKTRAPVIGRAIVLVRRLCLTAQDFCRMGRWCCSVSARIHISAQFLVEISSKTRWSSARGLRLARNRPASSRFNKTKHRKRARIHLYTQTNTHIHTLCMYAFVCERVQMYVYVCVCVCVCACVCGCVHAGGLRGV